MHHLPTNADRADRFEQTLNTYIPLAGAQEERTQTVIVDLLADLLHWRRRQHKNSADAAFTIDQTQRDLDSAIFHFTEEVTNE